MKPSIIRVLEVMVVFFATVAYSQVLRPSKNYMTEIVIGDESTSGFEVKARFSQNKEIELDSNEPFYIAIRFTESANPFSLLPFGALVKRIEIASQFGDKIFDPVPDANIKCATIPSRYPIKNCLDIIPKEVKDKLNNRNVFDLSILVRVVWRKESEVAERCQAFFPTDLAPEENGLKKKENEIERVDVFRINVRHFGLLVLFDLNPIAQAPADKFLDVALGLLYNLSYTGFDYAVISRDNNFKIAMLSAPVIRIEGRSWPNKNIEGQMLLVKDLENANKYLGYGFGIGLFGDTKIVKCGVFWYHTDPPRYYLGVSLPGLAKWIVNN